LTALLTVCVVAALAWQARELARRVAASRAAVGTELPILDMTIESLTWHRPEGDGAGRVMALFRNTGSAPIRIDRVEWDGAGIHVWGLEPDDAMLSAARTVASDIVGHGADAHDPDPAPPASGFRSSPAVESAFRSAYWSRLSPSGALAPGGSAMLTMALTAPLYHRTQLAVRAVAADGETNSPSSLEVLAWAEPEPASANVIRLAFAPGGERVYGYLRNDGDMPLTIARLAADVMPIAASAPARNNTTSTGEVLFGGGQAALGIWLPAATLPARSTGMFSWRPARPFERGAVVTLSVHFAGGSRAAGQTRALWGFPLGTESGMPPEGMGFDRRTLVERPAWITADEKASVSATSGSALAGDRLGGINVMVCPLCRLGMVDEDRFETAAEFQRRLSLTWRRTPGVATIVNPCRVNSEQGCAIFAPAADALMMNPAVRTPATPRALRNRSVASTARLARIAREASAPGLFYPLVDTGPTGAPPGSGRFVSPEMLRARVFTLLSAGADGLLFRHAWNADIPEARALDAVIPGLNAETAALIPWLEIGAAGESHPIPGHPGFRLHTRLAGDKGLIAFIVGEDATFAPDAKTLHSSEDSRLSISIVLPPWARPGGVFRTTPEGLREWHEVMTEEERVVLSVPVPTGADAYLVKYLETPLGSREQRRGAW